MDGLAILPTWRTTEQLCSRVTREMGSLSGRGWPRPSKAAGLPLPLSPQPSSCAENARPETSKGHLPEEPWGHVAWKVSFSVVICTYTVKSHGCFTLSDRAGRAGRLGPWVGALQHGQKVVRWWQVPAGCGYLRGRVPGQPECQQRACSAAISGLCPCSGLPRPHSSPWRTAVTWHSDQNPLLTSCSWAA